MAHSCTELGLVSAQPDLPQGHGAAAHCRTQGQAALATQGKDRWSLTLLWTRRQSPEKNTARGLFLIAVSGWYTDEPGSGNKT